MVGRVPSRGTLSRIQAQYQISGLGIGGKQRISLHVRFKGTTPIAPQSGRARPCPWFRVDE